MYRILEHGLCLHTVNATECRSLLVSTACYIHREGTQDTTRPPQTPPPHDDHPNRKPYTLNSKPMLIFIIMALIAVPGVPVKLGSGSSSCTTSKSKWSPSDTSPHVGFT